MLARQLETDDGTEVLSGRLQLVGERAIGSGQAEHRRTGRFAFLGNATGWLRAQIRQRPERYAHLTDRLIILGIIIVLVVSVYVFIADPS